jgi:hypothetical protein
MTTDGSATMVRRDAVAAVLKVRRTRVVKGPIRHMSAAIRH